MPKGVAAETVWIKEKKKDMTHIKSENNKSGKAILLIQ